MPGAVWFGETDKLVSDHGCARALPSPANHAISDNPLSQGDHISMH
jgi:hypothetical protein